MVERCGWAQGDVLYEAYHDHEWGIPVHEDQKLFEMLILEGAQAGLSWITVLRKRATYRDVFDQFDPAIVATYGEEKIAELLQNPGIIRNRLKVRGTVQNAKAFLRIQEEFGSFDQYLWRFVEGKPIVGAYLTLAEVPATSSISDAISKDLKKRGFTFVGSTIIYAFMQAVGLVNDHVASCFCYQKN